MLYIILVHIKFVDLFMLCHIAKFHMFGSSVSLVPAIKLNAKYRLRGSCSSDHDEYYLLACDTAWSGKSVPNISEKCAASIFMVE